MTSGAAAALAHATAACVAGADPEMMKQLPNLTGLKNEVIMPKWSRNEYDHAIRTVGVHIVEIDSEQEFHGALGRHTAMVAVLGSSEAKGKIRLEQMATGRAQDEHTCSGRRRSRTPAETQSLSLARRRPGGLQRGQDYSGTSMCRIAIGAQGPGSGRLESTAHRTTPSVE